jgi:hypothetical protein
MKTRARLTVAVLLTTAAASASTLAGGSAMQPYELVLTRCSVGMPLPDGTTQCDLDPYYVDCLGEYVVGEYHIAGNHQEFQTPSGAAHIRDNWKIISTFFGVTTSRTWYAVGVSPGSANAGAAETFTAAGSLTYKPLADGPTWQEHFNYKLIYDASGEIATEVDNVSYKCLGARR